MRSLDKFPVLEEKSFNNDDYGIVVQQPVFNRVPNGEIGIELEMEGVNLPGQCRTNVGGVGWTVHNEGSLRNGGLEYVLTAPCARDQVIPLVEGIFAEFGANNTVLNLSSRCSTHIHINTAGMKVNQIASFVTLWGILEDALVNWCGEKRAGNLFCLRFSDCNMAAASWAKAFRTGVFQFGEQYRYLALNANALQKFGSLEVRTLRGADTPDMIYKWVDALTRIKDLAMERYANPADIAGEFSGYGARGFINEVLRDLPILDEVFDANSRLNEDVDRLLWEGVRRVQPVMYALPWHEVIEESKKVYIVDPFSSKKKKKSFLAEANDEIARAIAREQALLGGRPMRAGGNPFDEADVLAPAEEFEAVVDEEEEEFDGNEFEPEDDERDDF